MPVQSSDIKFFKSAIGDSAGGAATATQITGVTKNNYWPDVSDVERAAGGTRTKKMFIGNDAVTDSLLAPKLWIAPDATGMQPTQIGAGFDDADDDTGAQGNMTAFGASALLEVVSSAADTRSVTVIGISGGVPLLEVIVLNGTTPVLSVATFSKVYALWLSAEHGTNTVTAKQGAGGTVRGTIGPNLSVCFLWVAASSEATSLWLPDLIAGARWGIWEKQTWSAGALPQRPDDPVLNVKEGV